MLARLRAGHPEPYLAHAARRGRLHVHDNPTAAKQRLLEDWWRTAERDLPGTVMLAYRRDDVRDLNQGAHALMASSDRLGREALTLGGREFRVGDRILCRRNDSRLGVRNGMRATIVDLERSTFTVRTDAGMTRSLPFGYVTEHLDHAYALTGHAAQGATVDRAFVLLHGEGALREWGYVACSRARTETRLYLADLPQERVAHGRAPEDPKQAERAAYALSRSSAESLALKAVATRDPTARLLARQQEQLDRLRTQAHERLAAAEAKLDALGWRLRAGRRAELRAEIALHRAALRLADDRLAELATGPKPEQPRMPREGRAPERARTRQLVRERQAPGIELDR